ncbi:MULTISPECIES: SulP family inorganic anion transporter [unclassified Fusibacter]|uniref:SulP family inorganic anion transporter n=1 Tax=unclassified Fusibacter TaxID=2624464 RepID=UPI001010345C|nr:MULTISPECIES: sulfate permease [unclassified Fusibacter]MCK8058347.1 sulfate permease [Fusibacter sp. A2]NPE20930.1 sulfate permease [Fusibacter sp. A1]RXV63133.1 STAS domain-containing protein [Fusibacter sp. A1]
MSIFKPKFFSTLKGYTLNQFFKDLTAGVIVAIIALPLSIALAIASGVSPEKGLHTAIVAGFIISFLGGSRVQIGGPTGAFMVIVYGIVVNFGIDGLITATFLAGILITLMGLFKLGGLIKFIPYPITTGFTSGIALTIFSSQIKDFLGLKIDVQMPAEFIEKWKIYFEHMDTVDLTTLGVGVLALLIIVLWPKVNKQIPGALIALIVTSVITVVFDLDIMTIGKKYTDLSSAFPKPSLPDLSFARVQQLIVPAVAIALLGSIESLLSAVVADGMIAGKHRSNTELIAQGIANMASSIFGGIPATGAIARTVANVNNGGRTPVAGMVHAVVLLLMMVVLMPLARLIPLSALAAILIVVSYNMSDWREFKSLFSSPKSDILVLLVTFFITVLFDLVKAIEVGMVLASLLFMKRMSEMTDVNIHTLDAAEESSSEYDFESVQNQLKTRKGVQIYEINGPFFFGAADKFLDALSQMGEKTDTLIVRMRYVSTIDATAIHALKRMISTCKSKHIKLIVTELQAQPQAAFDKAGLTDKIGKDKIFRLFSEVVN